MCIKNILFKIFLAGWMSFLLASCIDEHYTDIIEQPLPEGMVRVELYSNLDDFEYPTIRVTADETTVSTTPMVIVFEGANDAAVFSEAVQAKHENNKTTAILSENVNPCIIMVVSGMPGNKFFNATTEEDFTAQEIANALTGKTLAETEQLLMTSKLSSPIQESRPFPNATDLLPMSGILNVTSIDENTSIGTPASKLMLTRAVAKASVNVESSLDGTFRLVGAAVINAPRNTSVYRTGSLPTPASSELCNYLSTNSGDRVGDMAPASNNSTASNPLYIYECSQQTGTAVIIQAEYENILYYYKLAFYNEEHEMLLAIERNNNYVFTITSAAKGYETMEEAIEAPSSNINYEITVTDAYAHDMISNGQYYLGVSHSKVLVYSDRVYNDNLVVTTDAWNAEYNIQGIITYQGVTGTTNQIVFPSIHGSTGTTNVTVTMPEGVASGTVTIHLGNLVKTITYVREDNLGFHGKLQFPDDDYVKCEITDSWRAPWMRVLSDGQNSSEVGVALISPGKIYVDADMWMGTADIADRRYSQLHLTRSGAGGSEGRIRVYICQTRLLLPSLPNEVPENAYVGAFWRAEQTGERLIRIPYQTGIEGGWIAYVSDGEDWIMMDENPTLDTGVTYSAGESPADMNTSDALYQLTDGETLIMGNVTSSTDNIYFRIGLREPHTPTRQKPVRYGVVTIIYNDYSKYYNLYVRQGHDPDYLMRPEDPITGNASAYPRDYATLISPYNLTSQEYLDQIKSGGATAASHSQVGVGEGVFTEYPSQGGAFFHYANYNTDYIRFAWHPTNPVNSISTIWKFTRPEADDWWESIRDDHETCPHNVAASYGTVSYRRPNDGAIDRATSVSSSSGIAVSEIRTSLWPNPLPGISDNLQNNQWGFYADGFFDRHRLMQPLGTSPNFASVAASRSNYKAAYIGRLFYNPHNNASIFFPAPGNREYTDGRLGYAGKTGDYLTASSARANMMVQVLRLEAQAGRIYSSDQSTGYLIRCVVDE